MKIKEILQVKLFVGILTNDISILGPVLEVFSGRYGKIDYKSDIINFEFTSYYEKEMGPDIKRLFISFKKLINPGDLYKIKKFSNQIEDDFSVNCKRAINLDPGYLNHGKVILATTKDQQHRIYLKDGIFAEVTLRYRNKHFEDWEWTYPDYKTPFYKNFFHEIRNIYTSQI